VIAVYHQVSIFSDVSWREQVIFGEMMNNVHLVLDQLA